MKKYVNHQIISGGQAVVETLKSKGVNFVFGLIGSATMEIFDGLYKNKDIKFIGVRDERTGAHMADGYARASGKVGVMIAGQNGPGVTNLVTGIAQAYKAFSPIISLGGAISTEHLGKDAFQEIDQEVLFKNITKKTYTIKKVNSIPKTLYEAFKIAQTPRCGPVHINLPRDILAKNCAFNISEKISIQKKRSCSKNDIKKIIDTITKSNQPVIVAGGGLKNARDYKKIIQLAKIINIPIVSSAGHGDVIPSNESLYAGQMGPRGNPLATKLVKSADLILALGTRLGFNSTFFSNQYINKKTLIIQIDIESSALGRYFPIFHGICADVNIVIEKLINELLKINKIDRFSSWRKKFFNERKEYLKNRDNNAKMVSEPIHPSGLFKILRDNLPTSSAITLDAGTLCLQATDMLNFKKPPSLFTPLDFGLVGFSFACGLGVKLAKPEIPVISLMGDGGFGMTISELSTAVEYNINTITIVMNNNSWGAEKAYQRDFYKKRYIGADIKSPPFHKIAELYGAKGFYVKKLSQLRTAIKSALKCKKPAIINVEVDPEALFSFRKDSFQHKQKTR
tara:strand:- start:1458 stop:3161 length:1704 start_codon:yes stop_codon:yes gene_type:complete